MKKTNIEKTIEYLISKNHPEYSVDVSSIAENTNQSIAVANRSLQEIIRTDKNIIDIIKNGRKYYYKLNSSIEDTYLFLEGIKNKTIKINRKKYIRKSLKSKSSGVINVVMPLRRDKNFVIIEQDGKYGIKNLKDNCILVDCKSSFTNIIINYDNLLKLGIILN